MRELKYQVGDTIEAFLNHKWLVGVVLDHTKYDIDCYDEWDIEADEKVFASFPEFLNGKPVCIKIQNVKKLKSDLGGILYE